MRILLISDAYPPEVRSASRLMYEFATEMVKSGHSVEVLTAYPKYNLAEGRTAKFNIVSNEEGVRVIRIETRDIHLVGMIQRGIGVLLLPYYFITAGKKYINGDIDIVLVYSPPLTLSIAGRFLAKHFNANYVLNVQDIFPQNAIDLGIMKNPFLIWMFEMIEQYAYRKSDFITAHSEGNLKLLLDTKSVDSNKIEVVHNWVEIPDQKQKSKCNIDFSEKFGLSGKFVILFGGVMGPAQGLGVVLSAAECLIGKNACFLMVGDGTEKPILQEEARKKNLDNIIFHPFVEFDEYEAILDCADVGLVTLSPEMKTPVVPGKLVLFLAKKIPVLASLNRESDGRQIIQEGKCGLLSDAGDGMQLADNVVRLLSDPDLVNKMGESGLKYVSDTMCKEKIMAQYESLFNRLIK